MISTTLVQVQVVRDVVEFPDVVIAKVEDGARMEAGCGRGYLSGN